MKKFALLIYIDDEMLEALPEGEYDTRMRGCLAHADELREEGRLHDAVESKNAGRHAELCHHRRNVGCADRVEDAARDASDVRRAGGLDAVWRAHLHQRLVERVHLVHLAHWVLERGHVEDPRLRLLDGQHAPPLELAVHAVAAGFDQEAEALQGLEHLPGE